VSSNFVGTKVGLEKVRLHAITATVLFKVERMASLLI